MVMQVSPDRVERILELADVGVWQLHVPSGAITRSGVFLRLIQGRSEDLGSGIEAWVDLVHPADRDEVLDKRGRLLEGHLESYSVDYRVRRTSGGWVSLRGYTAVAKRDAAGRPEWICGLLMDVSREKELERRLHAVFDRPFQFIGLLSPEGILLETNRTSVRDSGYRIEDVLGKPFWAGPMFVDSPAVQQKLREGISRASAGDLVRFEVNSPDKDGIVRTVDFTLTPLRDDDGNIVNIIPEGRDISDLAQAREALRATEQRLRTASEAGNIGLWDSHVLTGRRWFSDQWWSMLGYTPDELPSTLSTFRELLHPQDRERVLEAMQNCHDRPINAFDHEYRMLCKDGSWRWIHAKGQIVERELNGRAIRVTGVHIDITERKEAEMRLAAAERLESIGRLAAGVAHEINTPVQYVNDSVYFVREGIEELLAYVRQSRESTSGPVEPPADLEYLLENLPSALDRAVDGLSRVTEIVRSMKEFSHADQAAMTPVDLNRAILSTLVVARTEYKYVAELTTDLGELPAVTCHGGQINQVILNLVVNAAHAIADRFKDAPGKGLITIQTRSDGTDVIVSVGDNGGGIPDAIRHRIFEPFFSTKEVGRGTGQGLSLAHNVVVQGHQGSLTFDTEAGRGTVFHIRLPIEPVAHPQAMAAA
jgi:PAS domain S-box-containing protein